MSDPLIPAIRSARRAPSFERQAACEPGYETEYETEYGPGRAPRAGADLDHARAATDWALRGRAGDAAAMPAINDRACATGRPPGPAVALIGVDWGPSRVRVHAFDARGGVIARRDSARGTLGLDSPRAFSAALDDLLDADLDDGRAPILLTGMVGARLGWQETPYASLPADAAAIAALLQPLRFGDRRAAIVPGVCGPAAGDAGGGSDAGADGGLGGGGFADVMRGEETQALGVPPGTARAVAPGAHSKWLRLRDGAVVGFASYPTGELYSLLLERSLLGRGLPAQAWSARGFALGLDTARAQPDWLHQLFGVRARHVRDAAPAEQLPAFLSGLLIGYECLAAQAADACERAGGGDDDAKQEIAILGDARLAAIYAQALQRYGMSHYIVEGDTAYCHGLWRIARAAGYV